MRAPVTPFVGRCHVAYLPQGKFLGLSKVARIVHMFARRLQIQEQLALHIAESIRGVTGAEGIGVIIEAEHMCIMMRDRETKLCHQNVSHDRLVPRRC